MDEYDEMCARLRHYRKSAGMIQQDMGDVLGLTQEEYYYIENGRIVLSYAHMMNLSKLGINIDFLLTGKEFNFSQELDDIESDINKLGMKSGLNEKKKDFILRILYDFVHLKLAEYKIEEMNDNDRRAVRLVESINRYWDDFLILWFVREENKINQIDMAQNLGLGIKKYRAFETEKIYMDAQLLLQIYSMSGYQPSLFFKNCDKKVTALKMAWKAIEEDDRKDILEFAKSAIDRIA